MNEHHSKIEGNPKHLKSGLEYPNKKCQELGCHTGYLTCLPSLPFSLRANAVANPQENMVPSSTNRAELS